MYVSVNFQVYVLVQIKNKLMRDERRKKEVSMAKQTTKLSNTAHPSQSLVHVVCLILLASFFLPSLISH